MTKKAILFGVNNYKHANVPDLRGCVNDVESIEEMLSDEFGFASSNIRMRLDADVKLGTLEDDWKWLVKKATAGDQLVFHFSGHGSQVADDNADERDGLDEILCLYDMDFNDPDTYLSDDQIHKWTKKLPDGVKMTFLLDCCHSGTGTRSLRPGLRSLDQSLRSLPLVVERASATRSKRVEVRRAVRRAVGHGDTRGLGDGEQTNDANLVLARYLVPPANVYKRVEERSIRQGTRKSKSRSTAQADTNHVRFSGCEDKQTSADAYIDGKFQGAFSAYFRKSIEAEGSDVSHSELINQLRNALADADFEQIPQLNPTRLSTAVFNGLDGSDPGRDRRDDGTGDRSDSDRGALAADVQRLIRKVDELIDVMESRSCGKGGQRRHRRDIRDRSLVYVHGICWHDAGYSDDWFEALRPHLDHDLANEFGRNRQEVLWSQHVSSGSRDLPRAAGRSDEEQQLADVLEDIIRDRTAQAMELQMSPTRSRGAVTEIEPRDLERSLIGIPGLDCVDDFIKYLLFNRTRRKVIAEFKSVVEPLLEDGHEIEVISHSWGTVVAFEALHQLSGNRYRGQVNNLFTLGSALSIGPIQRRLKFGAETGDKPRLVHNWVNLDARGDVVGGTLRGFSSEVDAEYLNLDPVGCQEGVLGVSPACAHSSYFNDGNTTVNREIFEKHIA